MKFSNLFFPDFFLSDLRAFIVVKSILSILMTRPVTSIKKHFYMLLLLRKHLFDAKKVIIRPEPHFKAQKSKHGIFLKV